MAENTKEIVEVFQTVPWFQELEPNHFDKLIGIASLIDLEAGQKLFSEGDKEGCLYIVLEGRVAIEMSVAGRGRVRIYTAEPMDIVGWSSITPVVRQRTAGAVAVLPSRLACLDGSKLRILCEEDHALGYIVYRRLANVVAARLLTTRLQLLDMFAHPGPCAEEAKNG
jgi:CRP/FNR family cyclic AMP-dependent transcriptional regulator